MFVLRSIWKSLGRVGVGAHAHVGDGQVAIVGNGGVLDLDANDRCARANSGRAPFVKCLIGIIVKALSASVNGE